MLQHSCSLEICVAEIENGGTHPFSCLPLCMPYRVVHSNSSNMTTFDISSTSIQFVEHVILRLSFTVQLSSKEREYNYELAYQELCSLDPDNDLCTLDITKATDYDYTDYLSENKHPQRGDVKIELVSPQGTKSTLLPFRKYDFVNTFGYSDWPFMSVHFWGENPFGLWSLIIVYQSSEGNVSVSKASIELYGTSVVPDAVATIPEVCDHGCNRGCSGNGSDYCDACRELRNATTLECISSCSAGTTEYNGYCVEGTIIYPPSSTSDVRLAIILGITISVGTILCMVATLLVVYTFCKCYRSRKRQTRARMLKNLMSSHDDYPEAYDIT